MSTAADFAPIAVFAYRRTVHLERVLDALEACPEFKNSPCFVFSDGPKTEDDEKHVAAVRALLKTRMRPNMTLIESPANKGLELSVTNGVTKLCNEFGRAIVIEDDLVVAPAALAWFNAALDRYQNETRVWQISGFQFNVPEFAERSEGLFLSLTTAWGWATWKRAWDLYDPAMTGWERLKSDRGLRRRFDVDGSYPYSDMLLKQKERGLETWDISWWWRVFSSGGVTLFPPQSLVANIGFDETATHGRLGWLRALLPAIGPVVGDVNARRERPSLPNLIDVSADDVRALSRALLRTHQKKIAPLRRMLG
jgi:hypothetical protein